jgi:hypothetical protein
MKAFWDIDLLVGWNAIDPSNAANKVKHAASVFPGHPSPPDLSQGLSSDPHPLSKPSEIRQNIENSIM